MNKNGVIPLHDNAKPHLVKQTLEKKEVLPHLFYLTNLVSLTYHLFKSIEHFLNARILKN